jgi:two-component system, OmpR family, KDP operon response regulator KdpE
MNERSDILLVEDEREIRRLVRSALEKEGMRVREADRVAEALEAAAVATPDLVILDLGLPDGDGLIFIREFRLWSQRPILVLSARDGEKDKIAALDCGADDFLGKPFSVGELQARLRALLRRAERMQAEFSVFRFGDVSVDLARHEVERAGQPVRLTALEFRLLAVLLANAGKVMTHRNLLREVWGPEHAEDSHYLRIYVGHLRQKLEVDPALPVHLLTEIGIGYRFVI